MGRLIDADDLIEYIKIWEIGNSISSDQKEFIDCVNKQPTAFDIDDVVAQLKQLKRDIRLDIAYENVGNALDEAIEIVKGSGLNERNSF